MALDISVTVGNQDITQYVVASSLSITRNINGKPSEAMFDCIDDDYITQSLPQRVEYAVVEQSFVADSEKPVLNFTQNLPVIIKKSGVPIFNGYLVDVSKTNKSMSNLFTCTCQDVSFLLEKRVIHFRKYIVSTLVKNILTDILTYVPEMSNDLTYVVESTTLSSWYIIQKTVKEALDELAARCNAYYYIDDDKKLHWRSRNAPEESSEVFSEFKRYTELSMNESTFNMTENVSSMINKVTVVAVPDSYTGPTTYNQNPSVDGYRRSVLSSVWPPTTEEANDFSSSTASCDVSVQTVTQYGSYTQYSSRLYLYSGSNSETSIPYYTDGALSLISNSYANGVYSVLLNHVAFQPPPVPRESLSSVYLSFTITVPESPPNIGAALSISPISNYEATYSYALTYGTIYPLQQGNAQAIVYTVPLDAMPVNGLWCFKLNIYFFMPNYAIGYNRAFIDNQTITLNYIYNSTTPYYRVDKTFFQFNTSSIPSQAEINNATLKLFSSNSVTSFLPKLQYVSNTNWLPTIVGDATGNIQISSGWNNIALGNTQYISKGAGANTILYMRRDHYTAPPTVSSSVSFNTVENSQNKPVLEVVYYTFTEGVKGVAENTESISQYGLREQIVKVDSNKNANECQQIAQRILYESALPKYNVRYSTMESTNTPVGSLVICNFPSLGIQNQAMLVCRRRERYTETGIEVSYDLDSLPPDLADYIKRR